MLCFPETVLEEVLFLTWEWCSDSFNTCQQNMFTLLHILHFVYVNILNLPLVYSSSLLQLHEASLHRSFSKVRKITATKSRKDSFPQTMGLKKSHVNNLPAV